MNVEFRPLHHYLRFISPLADWRAQEFVAFLASRAHGTIVDAGCGWAECLIQLLESNRALRGIGIDCAVERIDHARQVATQRGVADRLELIAGDARVQLPRSAHGALCMGASQIWGAEVGSNQPLDYAAALQALRRLVKPGSPVIYGEGIWSAPPTAAAIAPLAGRIDEFIYLPDLIEMAWQCGFSVVRVHEATLEEWDCFESGFTARYSDWLADHPMSHPAREEVLARAHRQRDAYFRGYRGILGMAYLALVAIEIGSEV